MQQHQLDRGSFSSAATYSPYGGGSIAGINMGAPQRQIQTMNGSQMPSMTRSQQSTPMQGQVGQGQTGGLGMGMTSDNSVQAQHFMQQSMSVGGARTVYGNGQPGLSAIGGSMLTQQVNSNGVGLGHQYQQSIRLAGGGEATVGSSLQVQRGSDGGLQYDSASFPVLSGGGGNGGNNRFSGLPMPQQQQQQQQQNAREEDFTIQNEDFPALPGSHVDRNSQKQEINSMMGNMMVGGQMQAPQGSDRIRELSQENLQHHLLEQQQQQQQQQLQLQLQQQGNAQNQAQGSAVSRGSSSLPQQQANALSIVESSAQGGNNSLANGSFLGIGVGGAIQGHLSSNGLGSTVGGTGVGVGGVGGVAGVSQSKEGGYGLAGLLDVIRMTDKDLNTLALGSDLTTFGLNLNSSDCLYSSFSSPFSEQPALSEPQYTTPPCYAMHPPSLKPDHLTKFQIETIFYLFYSMPKDLLQACAAQELYRREWRYHGELRLWLKMRSQQELLQVQPNIIFLYFDVSGWEARLFVSQYRGNIASGLLTEEEVRVKAPTHSQVTVANPGAS